MAIQVSPYHSIRGTVYHIYKDCTSGNDIERKYRKQGKGNKKAV